MDLSAMMEDGIPHVPDDDRQTVRPDVRMCLIEYLVLRSMLVEGEQDAAAVTLFLGAGEELTVGEGAGAALPETVVGFQVQSVVTVELGDVFLTFAHLLASLDDNRFEP